MQVFDGKSCVAANGAFALEEMLKTIPESRNALSAALGDKDYNSLRQVCRTTRTTLTEVSVLRDRLRSHLSCPARSRCANALAPTKQASQKPKPPPLRFDAEMARHRGADGKVSRDSLLTMLAALKQLDSVFLWSNQDRALLRTHLQTTLNALHTVCPSLALDKAILFDKNNSYLNDSLRSRDLQDLENEILRSDQANTWRTFCYSLLTGFSGHITVALAAGPLPSKIPSPLLVHLGTLTLLGTGKLRRWRDVDPYLERLFEAHEIEPVKIEFKFGMVLAGLFSSQYWLHFFLNQETHSPSDQALLADFVVSIHLMLLALIIILRLYRPLSKPSLNHYDRRRSDYDRRLYRLYQDAKQIGQKGAHQHLGDWVRILRQTGRPSQLRGAELLSAAQASGDYGPFIAHILSK